MKKLLLLFISQITLTNVSHASFPIIETRLDTPIVDAISNTESIDSYHLRMQKMGIDLSSCKCQSCRKGIVPKTNTIKVDKIVKKKPWVTVLVIISILSIALLILLWKWMEDFNKSGGIGVG